jgi:hypothetical protein
MTSAQERKVESIRKDLESVFFNGHKNPEIKKFEVKESELGFVSLIAEVGGVGDEGTCAEILCRERIHVFIGKNGAITYFPFSIKNGTTPRSLGRHSLYNVYYEQSIEESERRKLSQQRRREKEKENNNNG